MIDIITVMQSLEIRDEIYERFLAFKVKYNPNLSNEEFIQFLMTRYENCCLKFLCNGYANGVTEHCKPDSEIPAPVAVSNNHIANIETQFSQINETETRPFHDSKLITCPECKYTSRSRKEMEKHFNDCHDISGAFPCTCDQCFCNLSEFLAHYIICPIAATDLQNTGLMDVQFEEEEEGDDEEEDKSPNEFAEEHSPILQTADESFDEPLDFHMHSPLYCNPLNLVKTEKTAYNIDSTNSSSPEKPRLPDNNSSSLLDASSPSNGDVSKRSGKVYECEHCEKIFKSKGLLDQHKHLHYPPRHECEFCGRRFRWPPQFYTHKQQCSKRKSKTNDSQDVSHYKRNSYGFSATVPITMGNHDSRLQQSANLFPHSPQLFEQCLCGYKNSNSVEIYEHKRSCVTSARALILQKIIDYKSIQSPTNMSSNVNATPSVHSVMNNFMSTNSGNHVTKVSKPVGAVSGHNSKTNELKPFECDFCESRFMTKISLKQHLDGKHSDQAKYCCEKCGKGYFWNASYNYHKKKCTFQPLSNMATAGLK